MKIEIGKKYLTRGGRITEVVGFNHLGHAACRFLDDILYYQDSEGRFFKNGESKYDLIEEVN